jgi:hypothetical protein
LDKQLKEKYGIKSHCSPKSNRKKASDASLRRYRRRYKMEHFSAWLQEFRHLGHSLGIQGKKLSGHATTDLNPHPHAQTFYEMYSNVRLGSILLLI